MRGKEPNRRREYGMNTADPNSTHRSWYYWLTLVPLVVGASLAFLRSTALEAFYFGHYGKASQAVRGQAEEAGRKADLYGWVMVGLAITATIMAIILIPPVKTETLPAGLRTVIRFGLALILVAGSIFLVAYGLSAVGHYLK